MLDTMKKLIIELYDYRYLGAYDSIDEAIKYAEEAFSLYYKVDFNELHKAIFDYLDGINKLWEDAYISNDNNKWNTYRKVLKLGIDNILDEYIVTQDSNG